MRSLCFVVHSCLRNRFAWPATVGSMVRIDAANVDGLSAQKNVKRILENMQQNVPSFSPRNSSKVKKNLLLSRYSEDLI